MSSWHLAKAAPCRPAGRRICSSPNACAPGCCRPPSLSKRTRKPKVCFPPVRGSGAKRTRLGAPSSGCGHRLRFESPSHSRQRVGLHRRTQSRPPADATGKIRPSLNFAGLYRRSCVIKRAFDQRPILRSACSPSGLWSFLTRSAD